MFEHIWYLLTKQSKSKMTAIKMCWEWNWPNFWSSDSLTWFQFDFRTSIEGDHSPSLHGLLVVFNWKLLDFGYYNSYHEVEAPEDIAEAEEWNAAVAEAHKIIRERKRNRADV